MTRRIVSFLLCALLAFGTAAVCGVPVYAGNTAQSAAIRFVVKNDHTGMTFDPVYIEEGQTPGDAIPKLPQYVTDANGQTYKTTGWHTDPACTQAYVPLPVTGDFTLYANYVRQYLILLYAVDTSGSELPYPDFDAYLTFGGPGFGGGWFDEHTDVGIKAAAKEGFRFVEWRTLKDVRDPKLTFEQGTAVSTNAHDSIRMESSVCCVAVFAECIAHLPGEAVKENESEPTCTAEGSYESVTYCAMCRKELEREAVKVDALGHDFGNWTQTVEPTCTLPGEEARECARCGAAETRNADVLGHDFGAWTQTIEPTCTIQGEESRECTRCGAEETRSVAASGHAWGDWEIIRIASPNEPGEKKRVCGRCGETQTAQIPELILYSSADGQSGSRLDVTVPYAGRRKIATMLSADEDAVFTSSDPDLLQAHADGSVTFVRLSVFRRSATITAVSADGSKTAICNVNVRIRWWQYILWFFLGYLWY